MLTSLLLTTCLLGAPPDLSPLLDAPSGVEQLLASPPSDLGPLMAPPPPTAFSRAVARALDDDEVVIVVLLMADFPCPWCDDQKLVWSRDAWPDKVVPIVLGPGDAHYQDERRRRRPTGWPTTLIYWRRGGAWMTPYHITGRLPQSDQEILERPDGRVERFQRKDGLTLATILREIGEQRAALEPAPSAAPAGEKRHGEIGEPQTGPTGGPVKPTRARTLGMEQYVSLDPPLDQVPPCSKRWYLNDAPDHGLPLARHLAEDHGLDFNKVRGLSDQDLHDLHSHAHEAERGVRSSQWVVASWR